mmetsp:Transcript_10152/g.29797  ORF Transcript_10152/g.29797 Transcript_10152/m.29797 type:complete len:341 (-) Transcript_10152:97-1119(-)
MQRLVWRTQGESCGIWRHSTAHVPRAVSRYGNSKVCFSRLGCIGARRPRHEQRKDRGRRCCQTSCGHVPLPGSAHAIMCRFSVECDRIRTAKNHEDGHFAGTGSRTLAEPAQVPRRGVRVCRDVHSWVFGGRCRGPGPVGRPRVDSRFGRCGGRREPRDQARGGLLLRALGRKRRMPREAGQGRRAGQDHPDRIPGRRRVPGGFGLRSGAPGVGPRPAGTSRDVGCAQTVGRHDVHPGRAAALRRPRPAQTRGQLREPRGHRPGGRHPGVITSRKRAHDGRGAAVQGGAHGRYFSFERRQDDAAHRRDPRHGREAHGSVRHRLRRRRHAPGPRRRRGAER